MSLYIKGLDMPQTPKRIIIYPDGTIIDGDKKGTKILKAKAIEIPTPHGRLIDGDMVADMLDSMMVHKTLNSAYDEVLNMPTILEAEE